MQELVTEQGKLIRIGRELGRGGEGAVYQVGPRHAAKVYHEAISTEKQDKIRCMTAACTSDLQKISCWPEKALYSRRTGKIQGFLMPLAKGYHPLHHLYGPQHRKQCFPDKDWRFLLHAGRNMAAAFATLHAHGHLIGDVNSNLVYISDQGTVRIIDCDSFQIQGPNGQPFLCEVGVSHFTPPELQKQKSFRGCHRTPEHDHFGLALLLFHLLLMGRHPFSGVFSGKGDLMLEQAIETRQYAYAAGAARLQVAPPPGSVKPDLLSREMAQYFERAFLASGAQPKRPTALQWTQALDRQTTKLRSCSRQRNHFFPDHHSHCPWCLHQKQFHLQFFGAARMRGRRRQTTPTAFVNLEPYRTDVHAICREPLPHWASVTPFRPRPLKLRGFPYLQWMFFRGSLIATGIAVAVSLFLNPFLIPALIGLFVYVSPRPRRVRDEECQRRQAELREVQTAIREQMATWPEQEIHRMRTLQNRSQTLLGRLENCQPDSKAGKARLETFMREKALNQYLSGFFIDARNFPGIGIQRKATLSSFGLETADQLTEKRIRKVPGFGKTYARVLMDWRDQLAKEYRRRHPLNPTPEDLQRARTKLAKEQRRIATQLENVLQEFRQTQKRVRYLTRHLTPHLNRLHERKLQLESDLAELKK